MSGPTPIGRVVLALAAGIVVLAAAVPSARAATTLARPTTAVSDLVPGTVNRRLEARLGPYPWKVLRIVQSSGGAGMEGPGIVWIPPDASLAKLPYLLPARAGR